MDAIDHLRLPFSKIRLLTDNLTDAVIYTDRNFSILYLNKAAENIFEVTGEDVSGCLIDNVICYEGFKGQSREQIFASLRTTSAWRGEASLMQKNGSRLHLKVSMSLIRNKKGWAENILVVCANITVTTEALELVAYLTQKNKTLQKAQKNLRQVQQQFEAFMHHAPAMTWIVDGEGNHLFANKLWRKTFGISLQAHTVNLTDIFPPEMAAEYASNNRRVLLANTATEILEPYMTPAGERRLCKAYKFPIAGAGGETWVGGIALDITDHVARQEALQVSNERFRQVIKATSDAIWDWDVQADKVYRGEGFKKLFGTDLDIAAMDIRNSFVHPDDRERIAASLQQALESGAELWQEEYRFLCLNGAYKICVDRARILRNSKGMPLRLIGAMQDVTRQRQLEAELRKKEMMRRQAVSRAVIDAQERERFEISFELHEQISQTLTTCSLLLQDLACGEDQERLDFCRKMLNESISSIRNISHRINPGTLDIIGLKASLENFIYNVGQQGNLHIALETQGLDASHELPAGLQLAAYRVVQEQLNNILKHAHASEATVLLQRAADTFFIEIKDNGHGFEPGLVTKGAGLANMQHRAEMHQGEMIIESAPGQGTRLQLRFPVAPMPAASG